jgi:hypothetical protein
MSRRADAVPPPVSVGLIFAEIVGDRSPSHWRRPGTGLFQPASRATGADVAVVVSRAIVIQREERVQALEVLACGGWTLGGGDPRGALVSRRIVVAPPRVDAQKNLLFLRSGQPPAACRPEPDQRARRRLRGACAACRAMSKARLAATNSAASPPPW